MTLGRLVDGLGLKGVSVTVITPRRRDRNGSSRNGCILQEVAGIPIPRYPELRFGLPARRLLGQQWAGNRPDLVHIATEGPLGWSALRAAREQTVPVVSSFHTNFHAYGNHYGFGFMKKGVLSWLRYLHNQTERTFVPSDDIVETLGKDGFRNLRLLPRGVDTALFNPRRRDNNLRASWGATPETPVAIYVGRLAGEKNIGLVIRSWGRMQKVLPDLKLVVVGDGPDRKRLQRSCPDAHFAGMQQGEELAAHYASADCFPFASVTETFGNVVTEAMASGLVVLAYDYAAPGRFIQHLENGFLVPFNDEDSFLETAIEMARVRYAWAEMGFKAVRTMSPHSWDSIVTQYLSELESLFS